MFILKSKEQVFDIFQNFCALVENQQNKTIKVIRTDNGLEFVNQKMRKFLESKGILHQKTVSYSPQQNGVAERANRTVIEKARCLLEDAQLPKQYWAEAVRTAVYLNNRSPTRALNNITPYEAWFSRKPNLKHLKIFGSEAMSRIPKQLRKKWDPQSEKLILVGYSEEAKG